MRSHVFWHCEILDLLEKFNLAAIKSCVYAVEKAATGSTGEDGFKRKQVKSDVWLKPAILALLKLRQEDCFVFEVSLGNLVLLYFEFYSQTLNKDCFVSCVNNFLYNRLGS